ncbi:MAG: DUF1571 domain-containing protein [Pirellulaceae bacterium]|nr:DUF1571 domain-containing protein [Pirellulaceae bacterium]
MRNSKRQSRTRCSLVVLLALIGSPTMGSDQPVADQPVANRAATHPLHDLREYAISKHELVKKTVRDYSCQIVKRERIDGKLQPHQFMLAKVRSAGIKRPFAVHLTYQGPKRVRGRTVEFVSGENNEGMLVRLRPRGVTLRVDLDNPVAMKESSIPITALSFEAMLGAVIEALDRDIAADPTGANTQIKRIKDVKINGRPSTAIRIIHPKQADELEFHIAGMFIDNEFQIPTRFEIFSWPTEKGGKPVLAAEFTYVDLKVNEGLPNSIFHVLSLPKKSSESSESAKTARSQDDREVQ